jgi:hypothetical protein
MKNTNNFILDYDFDGDINSFLEAIQKGNAISYNDMPYPIESAFRQGKQIVLPLSHKNIIINLNDAINKLKNETIVKITMNIIK